MKAETFVKTHGLDHAKQVLSSADSGANKYVIDFNWYAAGIVTDDYVLLSELSRVIKSHDLVTSYNGLHGAKNTLKLLISSIEIGLYHGIDGVNAELEIPRLKQAIADVEASNE